MIFKKNTIEINELPLSNLGVFISKLPNDLLKKLKKECFNFIEGYLSGNSVEKKVVAPDTLF